MPDIFIEVPKPFLILLREFTDDMTSQIVRNPPLHAEEPEDDDLLADINRGDLLQMIRSDMEHLKFIMKDDRLGTSAIHLEEPIAEPIARAASAMRLHIRELFLSEISDKELEGIGPDIEDLSRQTQKAYACYLFLANLQEAILYALEPDLKRV